MRHRKSAKIIFQMPPSSGASGGIKTLLEHADVLRTHGFDVLIHDENRAFNDTYGIDLPVARESGYQISRGDILVRGETFTRRAFERLAGTGVRQVLFVQNHHYLYDCLEGGRDLDEIGIQAVAASSTPIVDFLLRHRLANNIALLPYAVTTSQAPAGSRVLRVAYMPRKKNSTVQIIRGLFPILNPDLGDVEWLEIDGLAHRDVMRELGTSAVFLSLQNLEGFGLPALEAMAAGCLVVGFTGGRGCEYADKSNALWVAEDDIEVAVLALGRALRWVRSGAPAADAMVAAGRRTANCYSIETRDRAVLTFYDQVITAPR